jgi:hypothetical protein
VLFSDPTQTICPPHIAHSNIRSAVARGLPLLKRSEPHDRTISICGAGPSLKRTWRELSGDVMACNSAIRFLADHVHVDYAFLWDADPKCVQFARRIEGCHYLVASRCDPSVFDALKGMHVTVWHAAGENGLAELLRELGSTNSAPVTGGSACITRAIELAYAMGYRDVHFHGADSSYEGDATHVTGSLVEEDAKLTTFGGRSFVAPGWLGIQAQEFARYTMPWARLKGVNLTVHGDGLLPYIWSYRKTEQGIMDQAAYQEIKLTIGSAIFDGIVFRHQAQEAMKQLHDAQKKIAEFEKEKADG